MYSIRFCCYEKPLFNGEEYMVTDDNTAMIVFQSNTLIASEKLRYGFQLFYKIGNTVGCKNCAVIYALRMSV